MTVREIINIAAHMGYPTDAPASEAYLHTLEKYIAEHHIVGAEGYLSLVRAADGFSLNGLNVEPVAPAEGSDEPSVIALNEYDYDPETLFVIATADDDMLCYDYASKQWCVGDAGSQDIYDNERFATSAELLEHSVKKYSS